MVVNILCGNQMIEIIRRESSATAVIGAQWGDEGKGKRTDELSEESDYIVRGTGGGNAGHTVIIPIFGRDGRIKNYEKHELHLTPTGIVHPGKRVLLGPGTAIHPSILMREMSLFNERGISTDGLRISQEATLVLDYHIEIDGQQEKSRGKTNIGTTKQGIGPAYEHKARRMAIRAESLRDPQRLMDDVHKVLKDLTRWKKRSQLPETFKSEYYEEIIREASRRLGPAVINSHVDIQEAIARGDKFLLEGAQGTLLSIQDGTYPYVTSSDSSLAGLIQGSGIPPYLVENVDLVYKAYPTRVGSGPYPTKMESELAEKVRQAGHEFGVTTGRPRDPGYFDGVAARYAAEKNRGRRTNITITRGDILTGLGPLKIAYAYCTPNGQVTTEFATDAKVLSQYKAVYGEETYYWTEDFRGATRIDDTPEGFQKYIKGIQSTLPEWAVITTIGTGPARGEDINLHHKNKVLSRAR